MKVVVPLAHIPRIGPRAFELALTIAEALGWRVHDPQLEEDVDGAGRERVLAAQVAWTAQAREALVGLLGKKVEKPLASLPREDGWYVGDLAAHQLAIGSEPPRDAGLLDQLRADLRGNALYGYAVGGSLFAAGLMWQRWYVVAVGLALVAALVSIALRALYTLRHGRVVTVRTSDLRPFHGRPSSRKVRALLRPGALDGVAEVTLDFLPYPACVYLVARHGEVELRVLAHPRTPGHERVLAARGAKDD